MKLQDVMLRTMAKRITWLIPDLVRAVEDGAKMVAGRVDTKPAEAIP